MKSKPGVYAIINTLNCKIYIGSSVNPKKREGEHFSYLKHNRHSNSHLQKSYNKYGEKNFKFKILKNCPEKNLLKWEQHFMTKYNSTNPNCGYNIALTANKAKLPEESIEKCRQSSIAMWNNPEYADRTRKAIKEAGILYRSDPVNQKIASKRSASLWQNPDYISNVMKGKKEYILQTNFSYLKSLELSKMKYLKEVKRKKLLREKRAAEKFIRITKANSSATLSYNKTQNYSWSHWNFQKGRRMTQSEITTHRWKNIVGSFPLQKSKEVKDKALQLFKDGDSLKTISQKTGLTYDYVSLLTKHLRPQKNKPLQEKTIKDIGELILQGETYDSIALKTGVCKSTVCKVKRRLLQK